MHAANLREGDNVSVTAQVPAADPLDQRAIGSAVWYAATVKDAGIAAAAGNEGEGRLHPEPPLGTCSTSSDSRDGRM